MLSIFCLSYTIFRYFNSSATTSVYLYVEDKSQMFINPNHFLKYNIHMDKQVPVKIGCRPTSPNAKLTLINPQGNDITNELQKNRMEFSDQTGLWVLNGSIHLHSGLFQCKLKLGKTEEIQRVYVILLGADQVALPSTRYK